ncbi:MAG TPA: ABC transporter permease [Mycobacteriales bacterium]|nr:ABC transporter permease [Mycobacteriales bacterium]
MASLTAAERARAQSRVRWELLVGLVRKDLKVKYQGSALGFLWSLANPLLLLAVYSFVFQVVFKSGVPDFGIYLMSGLLIWNAFSGSLAAAAGSVVGNAGLVKKVRFPLSVLPLSAVGFAAVHFVLQLGVLVVVMVVTTYSFVSPALLLVVPALAVATLFTIALSFIVAALNVRYRDTQHFVEILLVAWFWVNPIVYPVAQVHGPLAKHGWAWEAYFLNPMAGVITTMQRAIYNQPYYTPVKGGPEQLLLADPGYTFYLEQLAIGAVISGLLLLLGRWLYRRLQGDFAEEL